MRGQIQSLLRERLQWNYGVIFFTDQQPNEQFINTLLQNTNNHKLFLTTYPFQISSKWPSLWIQSIQDNKSLESVEKIAQFLIQNNANRNSHLIIKGGGLLMDLGGFAASLYMRGIKHVTLIPTTFLGMVDATVGGKTAVNYSNTKNLLGTIRNSNHIIICPSFLSTQTERQFFNGIVETIKMAITYDLQFFEFLEQVDFKTLRNSESRNLLKQIIKRSLMIKIMVVEKDLTEQNQRKWLNFGHTIGHAIELDENNTLLHGQCVAIGMVKALQISLAKSIISSKNFTILERMKKILKKLNLSCKVPDSVNGEKMIQRMLKDKKMSDSSKALVDFVLIQDIGKRCQQTTRIPVHQLRSFLGNAVEVNFPHSRGLTPINDKFLFPSSKSISLRYLFISCLAIYRCYKENKENHLAKEESQLPRIKLLNFLSSEDTQKMIFSLRQLGFFFDINFEKRQIQVTGYKERDQGELDVGNSGITARFILPLCMMIKGKWKVNCHKRMQERPNTEIFQLCSEQFQGQINYLNKISSFPVEIISTGKVIHGKPLKIEGKQSSQFISSAIINWSFIDQEREIIFKSNQDNDQSIVSQSYLNMTNKCLESFGVKTQLNKKQKNIKIDARKIHLPHQIYIENDLSTYSYPLVFYELHGFKNSPIEPNKYMQGDVLFYQYVNELNDKVGTEERILRYDFNNCTDTFMTFMVFCCSDKILNSQLQRIVIENISNQRVKQSNRIDLTIKNLKKIGIQVEEYQNRIQLILKPLELALFQSSEQIIFQTHQDHRLAMSFGILSSFLSKKFPQVKFIIDSKKAVQKTFPEFWKYLSQSGVQLNFISAQNLQKKQLNFAQNSTSKTYKRFNLNQNIVKNSLFIVGNRGSGKTTIGRNVAAKINLGFLDLDDLITEQINHVFNEPNIEKMVERYGWNQFRDVESQVLQKTISSLRYSSTNPFVVSTGGGILERQLNKMAFRREKANIFYLQRQFSQLKAFNSTNRPNLQNFETISKQRQPIYEQIASQIITFPSWQTEEQEKNLVIDSINKFLGKQKELPQGYILCLGDELLSFEESLTKEEIEEIQTYQIRIDKLLQKGLTLREIRSVIANWRLKNKNMNFILTLRSKSQLGEFEENGSQTYQDSMKIISKIPCDFLDHEVTQEPTFLYNYKKLIHSYHGNDENIVQKLINQQQGFKKFCFMKQTTASPLKTSLNLYEKYSQNFTKGICFDLLNPLSRFKTMYQMVIPEISFKQPSSTGIMTLSQMKSLKKILRMP